VSADGRDAVEELEGCLDAPRVTAAGAGPTAREVVRRHAGEVWAHAEGGRIGFRLTLPEAEPGPTGIEAAGARGAGFVGAGLRSGFAPPGEHPARPAFYDFSLFEMARELRPTDRERPLDGTHFVVLDVETTGLDPQNGDRIVSLAGVRVRGNAVRRGETFDALVNPGRPIPPASIRFHGITDSLVAEAPSIGVVLPAFLRFVEDAVLVGHEVSFDLRFLTVEDRRVGQLLISDRPVLDTLLLSEVVHGPLEEHSLDAVAARLGVAVEGRHSALGDALTTAEVLVRLIELLRRRGIVTLGHAMDAARRAWAPRPGGAAETGP
jgi:DNA polymerase-3 subunit epsilon